MSTGLADIGFDTHKKGKVLGDMCVGKRLAFSMQTRGLTLNGYSNCVTCTRGENDSLEGCHYLESMHSQTLKSALEQTHYRNPNLS
ncbi:hypothetical protein GOV12_04810 [Candidatus Pacearchaeota archaeon]|nr:hypothetical protein [Candidatus Pacearchaeota archaeon]